MIGSCILISCQWVLCVSLLINQELRRKHKQTFVKNNEQFEFNSFSSMFLLQLF